MIEIEIFKVLPEVEVVEKIEASNHMSAMEFLKWCRDEAGCCPLSRETGIGEPCHLPSNAEFRRWLEKGMVKCNDVVLDKTKSVDFPITQLIFFPKNDKHRTTMV